MSYETILVEINDSVGVIRLNRPDAMNALMAVPNLIGLVMLGGLLSQETKNFETDIRKGIINKFN